MFADLDAFERRVHSQNGEDGIIEALFERLGTTNKFFVELGSGDGTECNGAFLLDRGWTGLMIDAEHGSKDPRAKIQKQFINAENIAWVLDKYNTPPAFDLLSIDLDGNDFWIWQMIERRPRVVVAEYNAVVPPDQRLAIAYDPTFEWTGSDYFGASLLALTELGRRKAYELVYCNRTGVNAFFVAKELLPDGYEPRSVASLYRPPNYHNRGYRYRRDSTRTMIDPFA